MTAIRPPAFPPIRTPEPSRGMPADAAKAAAQKAFFQQALGQAPAAPIVAQTAAPTASSAPTAAPAAPAPRIPEPGAEKPQRILRPGSLLDIRI